MANKIHTHYDNLKVARNAPIEVIRAAYKTLSQKYHPDKNGNTAESTRYMPLINASYDVLSDAGKRREHDEWIRRQENPLEDEPRRDHSSNDKGTETNPNYMPPLSGQCSYWELPELVRGRLNERISGKEKDQLAIDLNNQTMKYAGVIFLPCWFVFVVYSAMDTKWSEDFILLLMGASALAAIGISCSAAWLSGC